MANGSGNINIEMVKLKFAETFINKPMEINFEELKKQFNTRDNVFHFRVKNAKEIIIHFWNNIMNEKIEWIPEYDKIAQWLTDNKGKGLFLYGANGRGKTVMIEIVIPAILSVYFKKVVTITSAKGMNVVIEDKLILDDLLNKKLLSIDDVGKESDLTHYGMIRVAFAEIMDNAEKKGNFILATSNLDAKQLLEKYDNAVMERIKSCCARISFDKKQKSLRKAIVFEKE